MKVLIVYHAPHCNDGFTAAWIVHNKMIYQRHVPFLYPMNYGEEEEQKLLSHLAANHYEFIYVVDFSLRIEILDTIILRSPSRLADLTTEIRVVDHHKTAFNMYAPDLEVKPFSVFSEYRNTGKVSIILDNSESGASLIWRDLYPNSTLPPLVAYVKDRDLYLFEHANTKAIHLYLNTQEHTIMNWDRLDKEMHHHVTYQKILKEGNRLLAIYEEEVSSIASFAVTCSIGGKPGLMVECDGKYASDVGNTLATVCGTFGLTYDEGEDGMLACSLRSNDDYDVEVIAKQFGGGGHLRAAGFKISIAEMEEQFWDKYRDTPETEPEEEEVLCEHGRGITDYCLHCGRISQQ